MPEFPEITVLSRQMAKEIIGKQISAVEVKQPKNLNTAVSIFAEAVVGKTVGSVTGRGKWLFLKLKPHDYSLLINLGMGAELLHFSKNDILPEKYQFKVTFSDLSRFTIHFWWFGYIHLLAAKELKQHKMTAQLGVSPLDREFTKDYLQNLLEKKKVSIKGFLLDQKNVAGIGNVYVQDILFKARLHPTRRTETLSTRETSDLYNSIKAVLTRSVELGGLAYERDFYGRKGGFGMDEFLVGYKEGKPCPICSTIIQKIKTGTTSSYICPKCQK